MIFLAALTPVKIIVLILIVVVPILLGLLIYWVYRKGEDNSLKSQNLLSDGDLLRMIDQQPDKMITKKQLIEKSGLDNTQIRTRLNIFTHMGILKVYQNSKKIQYHYALKEPIDHRPPPALSKEPFLTIGDILSLFKHFDFRLSYQKICIATGLPMVIIKEEMNYFIKEKIVTQLIETTGEYMHRRMFILEEPYRSQPNEYLELEEQINLDLEEIYVKEMKEGKEV